MTLMDGWETIEQVQNISDIPVIMLTAKGSTQDKVTGLSRGADDYLVKPFDEAELMARVKALLLRTKPKAEEKIILHYKGKELSREQLVEQIWGIEFKGEDRTVDSHIRNLRDKLKNAGVDKSFVQTVWGIGYKID